MTAPSGVPYREPSIDKVGTTANLGTTNNPSAVNANTPTPFSVAGNNVAGYAGVSQEYRNYSGGTDPRNQPLPAVQTMLGASDAEFDDGVAPRRMTAEELVDNDLPAQSEDEAKEVTKVVKARAAKAKRKASEKEDDEGKDTTSPSVPAPPAAPAAK